MPFGIPDITLPADLELPAINPRPAKRLPYFKEHPTPGKGRIKGSHNKIPYDLKRDLVEAAAEVGFDGEGDQGLRGYLKYLAIRHPRCFSNLLGKVLPMQASVDVNASVASLGEIKIISVPQDHYFVPDAGGNPNEAGAFKYISPVEPPAPKEIEAPARLDEAKLVAALENLSVETLERLAVSLGIQG